MTEGKINELNPESLGFSPGAKAVWRAFLITSKRAAARTVSWRLSNRLLKGRRTAARFAGVLTVIADCNALEISQAVMIDAIALIDWYLQEALRLAEMAKISPALVKAQKLLDWMHAEPTGAIGFRHILQFGPAFSRTKADAERVLSVLIEHGHIETIDGSPRRYRICTEHEG